MKKARLLLIVLISFFIISCAGSDTYRGHWKATDRDGNRAEIEFTEHEFKIIENGENEVYHYSQNSINISNFVETYGIKIKNHGNIQIHFPIPSDESKGAILDANGTVQYIIDRTNYISYQDVYGL